MKHVLCNCVERKYTVNYIQIYNQIYSNIQSNIFKYTVIYFFVAEKVRDFQIAI